MLKKTGKQVLLNQFKNSKPQTICVLHLNKYLYKLYGNAIFNKKI